MQTIFSIYCLIFYLRLFHAEFNPMPTEEMVQHFNELRQDIVLLYELKLALASCEYELQMLRLRYDTLNPAKVRFKNCIKLFCFYVSRIQEYDIAHTCME